MAYTDGDMIALREVPAHLPSRKGRRVHYSTVYRWATKGAHGRVLSTQRIGGVLYTTAAAIEQFLQQDNDDADSSTKPSLLRSTLYGRYR